MDESISILPLFLKIEKSLRSLCRVKGFAGHPRSSTCQLICDAANGVGCVVPVDRKISDVKPLGRAQRPTIRCLSQLLRGCKALRWRKEQASKSLTFQEVKQIDCVLCCAPRSSF